MAYNQPHQLWIFMRSPPSGQGKSVHHTVLSRASLKTPRQVSSLSWSQLTSSKTLSLSNISSPPSRRPKFHRQSLHSAQLHSPDKAMSSISADQRDPHTYTSGRWLRRDNLERSSRYITFDFDALCRRVVELCPGAVSIVHYEKKEGGFNRAFIFRTDNGKRAVAKLPFALAGPARLTTNSEVATIRHLRANTSIPIPEVLDWSDDASNAIGSEYIIMEHVPGVQLHQKWPFMAGDQQIRCIDSIYRKVKEIVDMEFSAYGSLYFVDAPLNSASKVSLNKELCIGPHCGTRYWNCNVGEPRYYNNTNPNPGPWFDLAAYCDGLIDCGISKIPPVGLVLQKKPWYHGSAETHLDLLQSGRAVIKKMSEDPRILDAAAPTLLHPDLNKRNIFVSEDDPTIITGIIDWQSSSIEPAFWYSDDVPDFAKAAPHLSLKDQLDPNSERCARAFDICTQFFVPKLSGPRMMDETLFRSFRYCYRTWTDGAVAFRHELIETSQHWTELGFTGSCPFSVPNPEELVVHQKEYKLFEAAHNLKHDLSDLLNTASDGWVPPEYWQKTLLAHRETFYEMLQAVLTNENPGDDEPIRNEEDMRSIWPFDLEGEQVS